MSLNSTLTYYDRNSASFVKQTVNVDMSEHYSRFEKYLKPGGRILDLGCGSGRDSLYFMNKGYNVVPVDGSETMCIATTELTGIKARRLLFEELDYTEEFDGIWACASLLHVPKENMVKVLRAVKKSLKNDGVLYVSYKYGNSQREKDGRVFSDYTETTFLE